MAHRRKRRLRYHLRNNGVPFNCRHCTELFACARDRDNHEKDAHGPNAKPRKAKGKEQHAMGRHKHHHQQPAGGPTMFSGRKKPDELFVIDYVTPHLSVLCRECGEPEALPVTGYCVLHDPVIFAMSAARRAKAERAEAEAARKAREAAEKAAREAEAASSPTDLRTWREQQAAADEFYGYGGYH